MTGSGTITELNVKTVAGKRIVISSLHPDDARRVAACLADPGALLVR